MCHHGSGGWGPLRGPPAPPPVQSGKLDKGKTGPHLVGHPPVHLCGDLTPSSHQQTSKTTQTQNCPPWTPTWSTCSQAPRPQQCPFHCSPQVGREPAGHPNSSGGPGACRVTCGYCICSISGTPGPGEDLAGPGRAAHTAFHPSPMGQDWTVPTQTWLWASPAGQGGRGTGGTQHPLLAEADSRNTLQMGSLTCRGPGLDSRLGPWGSEEGWDPFLPVQSQPIPNCAC